MADSPATPPRIISLLPAATEIAALLGLLPQLVGRSHECDTPGEVTALPALTSTRIDASAPSRAIHEQVAAAVAGGGREAACGTGPGASAALYALDADLLAALRPDIVLTQAACDVCAVSAHDVAEAVARSGTGARIVALAPASLADLLADILAVGRAAGRPAAAREAAARLRARIDSVACRVRTIPGRPRVALVEWLDPPMAAGNWMPELIRLAGGVDVLDRGGGPSHPVPSHWISWDDLEAADPDVVVLVPCGFTLDRVRAEAATPAVRERLERLRAFREGRCFAADGHHLFNRPGPRLVDSLELLAALLHPGQFAFPAVRHHAARLPA
jgi:iron complex transport system substrate-binding protein